MINCKDGVLKVKGNEEDVKADLATIVHTLRYDILPDIPSIADPEAWIKEAVETGLKTDEEIHAEAEKVSKRIERQIEAMDKILKALYEARLEDE